MHGELTKCFICDTFCHSAFPCSRIEPGPMTICQLCVKSNDMKNERMKARVQQQKQAERMLTETAKRFKPSSVGDNVLVPVPEVDRGRTDFRNVAGIITNVGSDGTYSIGTSGGTLKQPYVRSQFIPTQSTVLSSDDVPDKQTTLQEVATNNSLMHGQGFVKCSCVTGCKNDKCSCRRSGRKCNSRCHKSLSCENK